VESLGLFPSREGLVAQLLPLTAVVVGFWWADRRNRAEAGI